MIEDVFGRQWRVRYMKARLVQKLRNLSYAPEQKSRKKLPMVLDVARRRVIFD